MYNKVRFFFQVSCAALLFSVLFLIISCSDLFNDNTENYNTPPCQTGVNGENVNFIGHISDIVSQGGAVPAEYAAQAALCAETASDADSGTGNRSADGAENGAVSDVNAASADGADKRAALPEKPEDFYYYVTASAAGQTTKNLTVTEGASFSLALEVGNVWTVTVGMKLKASAAATPTPDTDATILSDSAEFDISAENPVATHNFVLKPVESGTGAISLYFANPNNVFDDFTVSSVKKNGTDASSAWNSAVTTDSTSYISATSLAAGVYEIKLDFKKGSELVYSTIQTINVLPNMTTNKWIIPESLADENGKLCVTQQLADAFRMTVFFVGECGTVTPSDTNGTGSPYKPLASISKALELISALPAENSENKPIEYVIRVKDGITENLASTITIQKNITIECWKNAANDKLGTATLTRTATTETDMFKISSGGSLKINGVQTGNDTNPAWSGLILDGNKENDKTGSGVYVMSGGTLTLNGGIIKNCATSIGGGVYIRGTVIMNGGTIAHNESTKTDYGSGTTGGGGVYISSGGQLTMKNGSISENSAQYAGGGVYIYAGENAGFTMKGGRVSQNVAPEGGGIYCHEGKFLLTDGEISNNNANGTGGWKGGGGLYVNTAGRAEMSGGIIKNNTASEAGGGVYAYSSIFTMTGGVIDKNSTDGNGGGVYLKAGQIYMSGTAVIGDSEKNSAAGADPDSHSNYAKFGGGICANYTLDSSLSGAAINIGYNSDNTLDNDFSGGIYYNYAFAATSEYYNGGGGIAFGNSSAKIANCKIMYNGATGKGGGINAGAGCTVENTEISGNAAATGGGVYYGSSASFELSDGAFVSSNTATGNGSGVYVGGSVFGMKGSAYVNASGTEMNDVYLESGKTITITGALTPPDSCIAGVVAKIKLSSYSASTQVLSISSTPDPTTTIENEKSKFAMMELEWIIQNTGEISKDSNYVVSVPNDKAHPYVLTTESETGSGPEVHVTEHTVSTEDISYYLTLNNLRRDAPDWQGSFGIHNDNPGVTFTYFINVEGTNSLQGNAYPGMHVGNGTSNRGNVRLIFDTTSSGSLYMHDSRTDSYQDYDFRLRMDSDKAGTVTYELAEGCTFSGMCGSTTYTDITEFFNAAQNCKSGSTMTITRSNP